MPGPMMSRKQRWRRACGNSNRRSFRRGNDGEHGAHLPSEADPAVCVCRAIGSTTTLRSNDNDTWEIRLPSLPTDRVLAKKAPLPPLHPARLQESDNDWDNERSFRSVSFEESTQVILVPTRHELKEVDTQESKERGRRALSDQVGVAGGARQEGGGCDEGIWWTMQECVGFRKAYRRQIFALGLDSCRTLLCPATMVFLAGAAEEREEEEREKRQKSINDDNNDNSPLGAAAVGFAASPPPCVLRSVPQMVQG